MDYVPASGCAIELDSVNEPIRGRRAKASRPGLNRLQDKALLSTHGARPNGRVLTVGQHGLTYQ